MKNKKYYALGLAGALSASMLTATPVFAAHTSGGATEFTYTAGQSTGTDPGNGSLADWTVDYPVKVVLTDSTVDAASGQKMDFKLYNTKKDGAATEEYTGDKTVTVTLKQHADAKNDNGMIKMRKAAAGGSGTEVTDVLMAVSTESGTNNNINVRTDTDGDVFDLAKDAQATKSLYGYLAVKDTAEKGTNYTQTLTWTFADKN